MTGAWFTPRPTAVYLARWTGGGPAEVAELVQLAGDDRLPTRLTYAVEDDGALRVTDAVLGGTFVVPVGGWFTAQQAWDDATLAGSYQRLDGEVRGGGATTWRYAVDVEGPAASGLV